jgi:hypothetical protein
LSVPRIATLATAAVTRVNHVLETASSPDFFSSLLRNKNPQKLHRATRSLHKLRDMSAFNFSTKMAEERWFCECEYLEDFSKMNL